MTTKTLARLLLPLILLAGCTAKPAPLMPACEFIDKQAMWLQQTVNAISAGAGHPDSPEALADSIATLQAIEAEVKAVQVSEDGQAIQRNTILVIGRGIAQLQWLQSDGSAAANSATFQEDAAAMIEAMKDLSTESFVLKVQCEDPQ